MQISATTEKLLAHLIVNFAEATTESRQQIIDLLGLDDEMIQHLDDNLMVDDDDGVHEIK